MFHFGRFPSCTYVFSTGFMILHHEGFPIRKSAGRSLFAAHRSLSQLVTSFFGSWCQGIPLVLFFAWTPLYIFRYTLCSRLLELLCITFYSYFFSLAKLCFLFTQFYGKTFFLVFLFCIPVRVLFLFIRFSMSISANLFDSHVRLDLSSRTVTRQVLSALCSLTSVFGMGTGGPSWQSTPTIFPFKEENNQWASFALFFLNGI